MKEGQRVNSNFYLTPLVWNCVCTEQEKETVWQTVLKLVGLVRITRREGLLYLEDIANTEDDIFLRSCLRYIVDANPTPRRLHEYVSIWFVTLPSGGWKWALSQMDWSR